MNKKTAQGLPDFLEEIGRGILERYARQVGIIFQLKGVNIENVWTHHLVYVSVWMCHP